MGRIKTNNFYKWLENPEIVKNITSELMLKIWILHNKERLGYKSIPNIYRNEVPDFICIKQNGTLERVEVELTSMDFIYHNHDIRMVDKIICIEDNRKYYYSDYDFEYMRDKIVEIGADMKLVIKNSRRRTLYDLIINNNNRKEQPRKALQGLLWHPSPQDYCFICGKEWETKSWNPTDRDVENHLDCLEEMKKEIENNDKMIKMKNNLKEYKSIGWALKRWDMAVKETKNDIRLYSGDEPDDTSSS